MKDFINIDFDEKVNPDLNINLGNSILPYSDNSIDYIYSNHFFEHITIDETNFLLKELFRVLKDGSIINICVPHYLNPVAYQNAHRQRFSEQYFRCNKLFDYTYKMSFRIYKFSIIPCNIYFSLIKKHNGIDKDEIK